MNERERLIRTLTCTNPDRPSYGDWFWYDSTRERWECEGLPPGLDSGALHDYFRMDHIDIRRRDGIYLDPTPLPAYDEVVLEETAEHILRRTADGETVRVLRNARPPAMSQHVGYPVVDRASWRAFRKRLDPDAPGRLPERILRLGPESASRQTPFGAWLGGTYGYIRNWLGVEGASYAFLDDPAWVEEMVEYLTWFYTRLAQRIFASGLELDWVMFWEDMAYNAGPLLSPRLYTRYCLPFYETMIPITRQHGVRVIGLDCDGDIRQLIPIWLDLGIQVMHPMEVAAGMDVREVRRQYGTRVSFLGGIDKRALAGGRAAIDAEVIPKVRELQDSGGGFIAETDHAIPPDVPFADFCYYRELIRSLCE